MATLVSSLYKMEIQLVYLEKLSNLFLFRSNFDSELSELQPTPVTKPRPPATSDRQEMTTPKTTISAVIPSTTTTRQDDKDSWDSDDDDLLSPETDVRELETGTGPGSKFSL